LKFKNKLGFEADCKISIIPIKLPCRPNDDMNLVVCYGFGKTPLMLITDLKSEDRRLAVAVTKVYLMRWRIEEFYRFKKQQLDFGGFSVRSLNSIRTLDLVGLEKMGKLKSLSVTVKILPSYPSSFREITLIDISLSSLNTGILLLTYDRN